MTIIFEPLFGDVQRPEAATEWSAGLDAFAYLDGREITVVSPEGYCATMVHGNVWIPPSGRALIPLGFKAQLPEGWECQVRPRSGLALKKGVTVLNTPGTIDADYPGEWGVILINTSDQIVSIRHGERIAQLVLAPVHRMEWTFGNVEPVTSRTGGLGSTGA